MLRSIWGQYHESRFHLFWHSSLYWQCKILMILFINSDVDDQMVVRSREDKDLSLLAAVQCAPIVVYSFKLQCPLQLMLNCVTITITIKIVRAATDFTCSSSSVSRLPPLLSLQLWFELQILKSERINGDQRQWGRSAGENQIWWSLWTLAWLPCHDDHSELKHDCHDAHSEL